MGWGWLHRRAIGYRPSYTVPVSVSPLGHRMGPFSSERPKLNIATTPSLFFIISSYNPNGPGGSAEAVPERSFCRAVRFSLFCFSSISGWCSVPPPSSFIVDAWNATACSRLSGDFVEDRIKPQLKVWFEMWRWTILPTPGGYKRVPNGAF